MIIPFLPLELKKYGIHVTWNGYIFGAYALAVVIGSLVVPGLLKRFNRKNVMIMGIFTMSLSIAGFGEIKYLPNSTWISKKNLLNLNNVL